MTATIGRAVLDDIRNVQIDGRKVSFLTDIDATSVSQMKALRQQLSGLVDNADEEYVPFYWSEDSSLDGYYRVTSVSIPPSDMSLTTGWVEDIQIQMEAIGGGAAVPYIETAAVYKVRTNAHGVTSAGPTILLPSAATFQQAKVLGSNGGFLSQSGSQTTETGSLITYNPLTTWGSQVVVGYAVPPASAYNGSVRIEVDYGGVWYPVVGRNIPATQGTSLRLNNGIIRVTYNTTGVITLERWYGGAWLTAYSFKLYEWYLGTGMGQNGNWVVVRNSPEQCTVKTSTLIGTPIGLTNTVAFTLTRGRCHVEGLISDLYILPPGGTLPVATDYKIEHSVATACSSVTAGIERTAADGNSMLTGILTPHAISGYDLPNGAFIVTPSAQQLYSFALTYRRNGGSFEDHPTRVRDNYLAMGGLSQRVVVR